MESTMIKLDTIEKIKEFNAKIARFSCDFDLTQGRYVVDAKSMLGIFSLDLSATLLLEYAPGDDERKAIQEAIAEYIVA